jgi:hypothetical protein
MDIKPIFKPDQLSAVTHAVGTAEDLVSNHYKMTTSEWLRPKYDVRTLAELEPGEVVDGPFAQIIRYRGRPKQASLSSATYDFYKICLQDHAILAALQKNPALRLLPFALYIITHELIHIVRFSRFLQGFDASPEERLAEDLAVAGDGGLDGELVLEQMRRVLGSRFHISHVTIQLERSAPCEPDSVHA